MIEIDDVTKDFGRTRVLDRVSFRAQDGMVTGFVGPNGAGKSTLLRIIAGASTSSSGTTRIDGLDYRSADRPGAVLGAFLSAESIPEHLTAGSYLALVRDLRCLNGPVITDTLELVGLTAVARRKIRTFSLGMRQRLGIAAAVMGDPQNLVLDEPVNGLDPEAIAWLRSFIAAAAARGKTVLLSSHHMAELALVAQRVVVLQNGRVTREGPINGFLTPETREVYFEASEMSTVIDRLRREGFMVQVAGSGATVSNAEPHDVGRAVHHAGHDLHHLSAKGSTLEESYFRTIREPVGRGGGTS